MVAQAVVVGDDGEHEGRGEGPRHGGAARGSLEEAEWSRVEGMALSQGLRVGEQQEAVGHDGGEVIQRKVRRGDALSNVMS